MGTLLTTALAGVAGALIFLPLLSTRKHHRHRHHGPGVLTRRGGGRGK